MGNREMGDFVIESFGRLIGFTSTLVLPMVQWIEENVTPKLRVILPYYVVIGILFLLWVLWHHRELQDAKKKLDNEHFGPMERALDQMENVFIRVETKRQKQRLKTIKEKK